jgi:hypothetical protein
MKYAIFCIYMWHEMLQYYFLQSDISMEGNIEQNLYFVS